MRTPPASVDDELIAQTLADHWSLAVEDIEHLPVGGGAHHWRATGAGGTLFVTLDQLGTRHSAASLDDAYATAADLAAGGLEMVCAPLRNRLGRFTVDAGVGFLSATPWLEGQSPTEVEYRAPAHLTKVIDALDSLHATTAPGPLRDWSPRVASDFAQEVRSRTEHPWHSGPFGEVARTALAAHGSDIERWTLRYHELTLRAQSRRHTWVPTHGEPHEDNQVVHGTFLKLVDWESVRLAPRERDYSDLIAAGCSDRLDPDPLMVELFALDWRLSEITEYADWFAEHHVGSEDDEEAIQGLHEELSAQLPLGE